MIPLKAEGGGLLLICLVLKCDALLLDLQDPHKSQVWSWESVSSGLRRLKQEEPGVHCPVKQVDILSSRFTERLCAEK